MVQCALVMIIVSVEVVVESAPIWVMVTSVPGQGVVSCCVGGHCTRFDHCVIVIVSDKDVSVYEEK